MKIDLNDPAQFTLDNVKKLIASKDDSVPRQLRVNSLGIASLSDEIGNINIDGLAFRLETWLEGNGYVGEEAANDDSWVSRIFKCLQKNWPNPTDTFIDSF